jgi:hypothetical protein
VSYAHAGQTMALALLIGGVELKSGSLKAWYER